MKYLKITFLTIFIILIIVFSVSLINKPKPIENKMIDLTDKTIEEIKEFSKKYNLHLTIKEEHSDVSKDKIISQNIKPDEIIEANQELIIIVSLGSKIDYNEYQINELGNIPIMMYHGIYNMENNETKYIGGNVDADGYNRTAEAFIKDLEFYYQQNYRMIKLRDYINQIIDVPLGKSPIILTFDDGNINNIKVTGLDNNGNIIIDPNSAVGILEQFKQKYPDYNVTATFFINGSLFNQPEYNEKIIKWLIEHNYDIGNHSYNHIDFTIVDSKKTEQEVGQLYQKLNAIIPDKYVNIIALPFGSPYNINHPNFNYILKGTYNNFSYQTEATLRVGWEAELSPFSNAFDNRFLKRIRAYDNNGNDFDIAMNFKILDSNRYISDGNKETIVIPKNKEEFINKNLNLTIITY